MHVDVCLLHLSVYNCSFVVIESGKIRISFGKTTFVCRFKRTVFKLNCILFWGLFIDWFSMFEEHQAQIHAVSGDYDFWVGLIMRKEGEKIPAVLDKATA